MPHVVVVEPPASILALEAAKQHLRVAGGSDDDMIMALAAAVAAQLDGPEGWLGRSLGRQVLEWRGDRFPYWDGSVALPCGPSIEIVSVTYDDPDGLATTLPALEAELHGEHVFPRRGLSWPRTACRPEAARIRYRAGYEAEALPAPILPALKLMLSDLYSLPRGDSRIRKEVVEGVGSTEWDTAQPFDAASNRAVSALLSPLRIWR